MVLETLPDILDRDCGLTPQSTSYLQKIIDDFRDRVAAELASDKFYEEGKALMTMRIKDVRLTCLEIAINAKLDVSYTHRIMAQYVPLSTGENGESLYSIAQMMGAMFRGDPAERQGIGEYL